MPAYGTVEADEIAVLPDPVTWRVGRFSSEIALARLQMRGLETISTTRRNGQGPDSSLKRRWVFVWIHVCTVAASWTVTQSPNPSNRFLLCIKYTVSIIQNSPYKLSLVRFVLWVPLYALRVAYFERTQYHHFLSPRITLTHLGLRLYYYIGRV